MTGSIARQVGALGALGLMLALLVLVPGNGYAAEAGPGTDFLKCRSQSWADYNSCLVEGPDTSTHRAACFIAWDLDNIGCDVALLKALILPW